MLGGAVQAAHVLQIVFQVVFDSFSNGFLQESALS